MRGRDACARLGALAIIAAFCGCGTPGIDPRTFVELSGDSFMDGEQREYVDQVVADFESDPCAAADRLRSRDIALGPSIEVQLLQAYSVARALCTLGIDSFEVGTDQLGRLSFSSAAAPVVEALTGVLLSEHFDEISFGVNQGEPRCGMAWTSEPYRVAVLNDESLLAEAADDSYELLWVGPGQAINCADRAEHVAGTELLAGQLAELYVLRDTPPTSSSLFSLRSGRAGGAFVRFSGSTIQREFNVSDTLNSPIPDDGSFCSGYIDSSPTLTIDFGTSPHSIEIELTSQYDTVLFVTHEDGRFIDCNDDGPFGLDSFLTLFGLTGRVSIYIGSYSQMQPVDGTVVIREY
jgi:hypothetical protein